MSNNQPPNPQPPTPKTQHPAPNPQPPSRAAQAWVIAKIELRRAFFSRRAFWVYGLALFPAIIFLGHGIEVKIRRDRLSARGVTQQALLDSAAQGESAEEIIARLGRPADDYSYQTRRRVRAAGDVTSVTSHVVEPAVDARFVRLNITRFIYSGDPTVSIYEFEVYGVDGATNLALRGPAVGSASCSSG